MSEIKTGLTEFMATAATMPRNRQRLIQKLAIRRALKKGDITKAQATELKAMDWQSFLDWLLENGPKILEFIMKLIAIFAVI